MSSKATRESAVWILDDVRLACYPPPLDLDRIDGEMVNVTLRVHQTLFTSQAYFWLFPQRRLYSPRVPNVVQNGPQDIQVMFGLAGSHEMLAGSPLRLAAQNTWYRGWAAQTVWVL